MGHGCVYHRCCSQKAKDSFNSQWTSMVKRKENIYGNEKEIPAIQANGKDVKDSRGLWRNNRYTVIDTIAYWKPIKNLTFTAGVYNLTNKNISLGTLPVLFVISARLTE